MLIDFENEFGEKVLQKLPEDMLEEASKQVCLFGTDKFVPEPCSVEKYLREDA